ncbi:MAG: aldo/keto reductase [Christensenellaceae bacterium]|nr:aldo/keto reductase [Christensenellaceae bacterium]
MLNEPSITLNNGVKIPVFGLGVFRSEPGQSTADAVAWALEAGYRHIDTAAAYRNEEDVAAGIERSGVKREEIFITTKLSTKDIEAKNTAEGFETSLKKLKTDYVDLYLLHWPVPNYVEAWEKLIGLYEQKRIRAIGVSNFQIHHLQTLESLGLLTPAANQIELHPSFQQKDVKPYCEEKGIAVEAWSPLGGQDHLLLNEPVLLEIAKKHGKTAAQVIIRWHIDLGNVVIPKSVKQARIAENAQVFDFKLDASDLAKIAAMDTNQRSYWDPERFGTK